MHKLLNFSHQFSRPTGKKLSVEAKRGNFARKKQQQFLFLFPQKIHRQHNDYRHYQQKKSLAHFSIQYREQQTEKLTDIRHFK